MTPEHAVRIVTADQRKTDPTLSETEAVTRARRTSVEALDAMSGTLAAAYDEVMRVPMVILAGYAAIGVIRFEVDGQEYEARIGHTAPGVHYSGLFFGPRRQHWIAPPEPVEEPEPAVTVKVTAPARPDMF
jgi:hypothetical protein